MKNLFVGLALVAGTSACSSSPTAGPVATPAVPPAAPAVAAQVVLTDAYPAPAVAFAGGVTGHSALAYWQPTGYRPLLLDLYQPPKPLRGPRRAFRWSCLCTGVGG